MQVIISYFWQICRLKAGPEQVPDSFFAVALSFSVYFVLAIATLLINRTNIALLELLASIFVGVGLEVTVVLGVLALKSVRSRFTPTITALFGANAFILLITLPINALLGQLDEGLPRQILETLLLVAFFWWIAIAGFVFHRAANISLIQGMVLIFGVEIMATIITFNLFPPANG